MEQAKKSLKITSILVLALAGVSLLEVVTELLFGELNSAEGYDAGIVMATKIILLVVSLVTMIPQIYIGVKGLRIAKKPDASKAHIIWAMILFVISALSLISPVITMVKQGSFSDFSSLLSLLVDVMIYFEYVMYARQVKNELAK